MLLTLMSLVVDTYNTSRWETKEDWYKFKASLVYLVSSRPVMIIE